MEKIKKPVVFLADADADADAEAIFRAIVDTVREPLVVLDKDLRVKLANASFYKMFRLEHKDAENKRIYEVDGQWDVPKLRALLEEIVPQKTSFENFTLEHIFHGIGRRILELNARRIVGDGLILLAIEDVTERVRTQQLVEQARDQALKSRDELISVVSHEIKNPLTTITSSLDLIAKMCPQRESQQTEVHKLLGHIRDAAHRMMRITSDLIDATKIESGLLSIETSLVDIPSLIDEMVTLIQPLASQKAIRVEQEVAPDAKTATGDRDRIIQVLTNLLSNAVKFTGNGGVVRVEVTRSKDQIHFQVTDTGCGISEDQLPHVFERFWQAKHCKYLGTGLGLFIAKRLIERQGGEIGVISTEGKGSTFFFTLPAVAKKLAQKSA